MLPQQADTELIEPYIFASEAADSGASKPSPRARGASERDTWGRGWSRKLAHRVTRAHITDIVPFCAPFWPAPPAHVCLRPPTAAVRAAGSPCAAAAADCPRSQPARCSRCTRGTANAPRSAAWRPRACTFPCRAMSSGTPSNKRGGPSRSISGTLGHSRRCRCHRCRRRRRPTPSRNRQSPESRGALQLYG